MKRIYKLTVFILVLTIIMSCMSGCYDALDINKKHIVTAVILDYKDEQVCFNVEIADIESSGSDNSGGDKYKYITGKGKTIMASKEDLNRTLDRQLYLSAIRTIIFTENFINEYMVEYLNRLRASEQYNKKVIIVTTNDDPQEIIDICVEKNLSVGFSTEEMLSTLQKQGESYSRTTEEVIEKFSNKYAAMLLPSIGINNGTNTLVGYTVVDKNKVKGFVPADNARGAVLLNREEAKSHYLIPYNEHNLSIEGEIKDCKIKPDYKNGEISFKVECEMKASLLYSDNNPLSTFLRSDYEKIEFKLQQEVRKDIEQTVKQAQNDFGCDYLHFDDAFRIKYPEIFEQLNWTEEFEKAKVDVKTTINLDSIWLMDYEK